MPRKGSQRIAGFLYSFPEEYVSAVSVSSSWDLGLARSVKMTLQWDLSLGATSACFQHCAE